MDVSRRNFIVRTGQLGGVAGIAWTLGEAANPSNASAAPDDSSQELQLTRATNASVAASTDGRVLVMDLLNVLWALPGDGGRARQFTTVEQEASEPDVTADGRRVVFQSYADGNFHIYTCDLDGRRLQQLTRGESDQREPRFSPDGRWIAYSGEAGNRYAIHVIPAAGGQPRVWTQGAAQESQPAWTPDGAAIAFASGTGDVPTRIDLVDASSTRTTLVNVTEGRVSAPSFSPDGVLSYVHLTAQSAVLVVDGQQVSPAGEEVFPFPARWISRDEFIYFGGGRIRRMRLRGSVRDIPFVARTVVPVVRELRSDREFDGTDPRPVKGIVGAAPSPDGTAFAFAALGDLWLVQEGRKPRSLIGDGHHNTYPAWSRDGRSIVYCSDCTGYTELWLLDIASGQRRQLTSLRSLSTAPAFSPDGSQVAFVLDEATVHTLDVATGGIRKVVGPLRWPGNPTFTADGKRLSLAALVPITGRYREGRNQILTVDLDTGRIDHTEPIPGRSLANRIDSGPVYSPDGLRIAYVVGGTLWVSDVDSLGRPTGTARRVGNETADAPAWTGDGRSIMYINNGRLRVADATRTAIRDVNLGLTWKRAHPAETTVIRAGALWDGMSTSMRRNVDVVVRRNRIAAIVPAGAANPGPGDRHIDARGLTVMPGMIAVHEHGPWLRDDLMRLWLSFGITSIRTPGNDHYRAVEAKEAMESGHRIAPRLFAAGDLLDGSRIYYNNTRPVLDREDMLREQEKSQALGHDLTKTYVRFPYNLHRATMEEAHRRGMRATSHYLYGPLRLGADGTEHIGGTSRYGRRQKETHLGNSFEDVTAPLIRSGMSFTPTLGLSGAGLPQTRTGMYRYAEWAVGDRRLTTLLGDREYENFRTGVAAALATEPVTEMAVVRRHAETVARLIADGAHVAIGTDSPLSPFAILYHLNLQALVRYGVPPYDVLRAATVQGARALGVTAHLGTLEPGKLADLAFIEGDPLEDVGAAAAVRKVGVGGFFHDVDDLVAHSAAAKASGERAAGIETVINPGLAEVPQSAASDCWWHHAHYTQGCC